MANLAKKLARVALTATSATPYTVPASTTTVVTNIVICNPTGSAVTASMTINAIDLLGSVSIAANSVFGFDLKQVVPATQIIAGSASSTSVDFHISGVEIS